MLKRGLIVVIVILLLTVIYQLPKFTGYAVSEKISYSTQIVQINIQKAELINNQVNALIQNKDIVNVKLFITITGDKGTDSFYDANILAAKETKKYLINFDATKTGTPTTLTITPYLQSSSGKIVYKFSETSLPITQLSTSPTQNTTQPGEDTQILTESESQETTYIYANGLVASLDDQGNINYYHKDNLGSIRAITDSVGAVVYSTSYEPFGNEFSQTGSSEYSYTGKPKDNSGLMYYGARYYDPSLGRFTQIDPILSADASPYVYVKNNPLIFVDPSGNEEKSYLQNMVDQGVKDYFQRRQNQASLALRREVNNVVNLKEDWREYVSRAASTSDLNQQETASCMGYCVGAMMQFANQNGFDLTFLIGDNPAADSVSTIGQSLDSAQRAANAVNTNPANYERFASPIPWNDVRAGDVLLTPRVEGEPGHIYVVHQPLPADETSSVPRFGVYYGSINVHENHEIELLAPRSGVIRPQCTDPSGCDMSYTDSRGRQFTPYRLNWESIRR